MLTVVRTEITKTVHLPKAVGKNAGECGTHASNQVEYGIALLELVSWVPAGEKVCAALVIISICRFETNPENGADILGRNRPRRFPELYEEEPAHTTA